MAGKAPPRERVPGAVFVPQEPTTNVKKAFDAVARKKEGWARVQAANDVLESKCGTLFMVDEPVWKDLMAVCGKEQRVQAMAAADGKAPAREPRRGDLFAAACEVVGTLLAFYRDWYPDQEKPWFLQPELPGGHGGGALVALAAGYGFGGADEGDNPLLAYVRRVVPPLLDFSGVVALHCRLQECRVLAAHLGQCATLQQVHDVLKPASESWAEKVQMVLAAQGPEAAMHVHVLGPEAYDVSYDACVTMPLRAYNELREAGASWLDVEAMLPSRYAVTQSELKRLVEALFSTTPAAVDAPRTDMMKPLLVNLYQYYHAFVEWDAWDPGVLLQCGCVLDGMDGYVATLLSGREYTFRAVVATVAEVLMARRECERVLAHADQFEQKTFVVRELKGLLVAAGVPERDLTSKAMLAAAHFLAKVDLDPMADCDLAAFMKMKALLATDFELKRWVLLRRLAPGMPLSAALDHAIAVYDPPGEYERRRSRAFLFHGNAPQLVAVLAISGLAAPALHTADDAEAFAKAMDRLFSTATPAALSALDLEEVVQQLLSASEPLDLTRVLEGASEWWDLMKVRSALEVLVVWGAASAVDAACAGHGVDGIDAAAFHRVTATQNAVPKNSALAMSGLLWCDVAEYLFDRSAPLVVKRVECVGGGGPPIPVHPLAVCINAGLLKGCKGKQLMTYCTALWRDRHHITEQVVALRAHAQRHLDRLPWELTTTAATQEAAVAEATVLARGLEWYRPAPLFMYTTFFGSLDSLIHAMYLCWAFCEDPCVHRQRLEGFLEAHPPVHHTRWGADLLPHERQQREAVLTEYLQCSDAVGGADAAVRSLLFLRCYEAAYLGVEDETYFAAADQKTYDVFTYTVRLTGVLSDREAFWVATAGAVAAALGRRPAGRLRPPTKAQLTDLFLASPAVRCLAAVSTLHLHAVFKHTSAIDSACLYTKGPLAVLPREEHGAVEWSVGLFRKLAYRLEELLAEYRDWQVEAALPGAAEEAGDEVDLLQAYAARVWEMDAAEFWLVLSGCAAAPVKRANRLPTSVTEEHWLWVAAWHELAGLVFTYADVEAKAYLTATHLLRLLRCPIRTLAALDEFGTDPAASWDFKAPSDPMLADKGWQARAGGGGGAEDPPPFRVPYLELQSNREMGRRGFTHFLASLAFAG